MPIIDEYTRECLVIDVARSIPAQRVVERLEALIAERGAPAYLRSDTADAGGDGPEFIARTLQTYLASRRVATRYIEPGAPWQNGYVESFNATLRGELLEREMFATTLEAQVLSEQYRRKYNTYRPHSGLDYQTPADFAANCLNQSVPLPQPVLALT